MKNGEREARSERGQAAVFGVLILLMFAAYGVMTVMDVAKESASVVHGLRSQEALYAAEAGLEYAIEEIRAGKQNAGNISNLSIGNTKVTVRNQNNRTLTSTASVNDLSLDRSVMLGIRVSRLPAAFEYALYVDRARNENLRARGTIEGNILYDGNRIVIGRRMKLKDCTLFVPRSAVVRIKSGSQIIRHDYMYMNDQPDDFPGLNTGYYRSYTENDNGYESEGPVIDKPTDLKKYKDRVLYCDGSLTIRSRIKGPGIICARDDILLTNNARVGPGVTVIAGEELRVQRSTVVSSRDIDSILFSFAAVRILDGSDVTASIVSNGDLSFGGTTSFEGLCYSRGTLDISGRFDIEGSLVTRKLARFRGRGTVRYSQEVVEIPNIPGMTGRPGVDRLSWKEI